jgi:hypothetical protein
MNNNPSERTQPVRNRWTHSIIPHLGKEYAFYQLYPDVGMNFQINRVLTYGEQAGWQKVASNTWEK